MEVCVLVGNYNPDYLKFSIIEQSNYRKNSQQLVLASLNFSYLHHHTPTPEEEDTTCRHDYLDCPHHPITWEVSQYSRDIRRFRPIYFNTPRRDPVPWYEREEEWP